MGFSTLLDILGSVIIGGLLLVILLRINNLAVQKSFTFTGDQILQKNLTEVVKLIEYDFRQMGYQSNWSNVHVMDPLINSADNTSISFDVDGSTYMYYVGDTTELSGTPNPHDILLYRKYGAAPPMASNMGITKFHLSYFDVWDNKLATPVADTKDISTIQIDVVVEDVYGYRCEDKDGNMKVQYGKAAWRQIRMSTRNQNGR